MKNTARADAILKRQGRAAKHMVVAPSDADATCELLRTVVAANWATPGRRGMIVDLAGADEVMVTGDLHGSRRNLKSIIRRVALKEHPKRHLVLQELVHGGSRYPNGGDRSHLLVEAVCRLKAKYPDRVHILLGNHELSELTGRRIGKRGEELNMLFRLGLASAYSGKAIDVAKALNKYYASLPVVIRLPNRIALSHSIPPAGYVKSMPLKAMEGKPTPDMLGKRGLIYAITWGRNYRAKHADRYAEWLGVDLLITGHEPCDNGWANPNPRQLIVDCCRAPAGCLTIPTDRPQTMDQLIERIEIF